MASVAIAEGIYFEIRNRLGEFRQDSSLTCILSHFLLCYQEKKLYN